MAIVIFLIVFYLLTSISLYFLFPKLELSPTDALIPGKNFALWAEKIGRPKWYPWLLLLPIVNIFIFTGMAVNLVRSFKQYKFWHTALAVLFCPAIFYIISKDENAKYGGPNYLQEKEYNQSIRDAQKAGDKRKLKKLIQNNPYKKTFIREWVESIFFAVFAAAFIRMFLIEAFVIPTPSMEGSLLVGDFLFVSKASYGIRTPMTVAMIPLLHNRIPVLDKESYLKSPKLPYKRLPALEKIENGKPIVFNWPVGDSVYITKKRSYTLEQVRRDSKKQTGDPELWRKVGKQDFVVRPIDKKDHYIKRCIASPGDSMQIIDRQVYVNGVKQKNPQEMQFAYNLVPPRSGISKRVQKKWNIAQTNADRYRLRDGSVVYFFDSTQVQQLKSLGEGVQVSVRSHKGENNVFPYNDVSKNWTIDNYGPIWIPKEGSTTPLNMDNIAFYERVISVYENNDLEIKGGKIFINGSESNEYTFKQNYYWGMGDNRHNSEDSRMWGYIPHDHIVGKPLFIWFSTKNANMEEGIRFNRIFKSANVK